MLSSAAVAVAAVVVVSHSAANREAAPNPIHRDVANVKRRQSTL